VLGGVALRLGWSVYAVRTPQGLHDPGLYRALAASVADGHGYTYPLIGATAYYPPGYPVVLAPFVWVFEHSFLPGGDTAAVVALNLLAGAATIVLTAAVARRLAGDRVAVAAAVLVAIWPNLVLHSAVALSETLFLPLVLAIVLVAVEAFGSDPPIWDRGALNRRLDAPRLVGLGVLVAAASYVRPVALPIMGVLLVAGVARGVGWRRAIGGTAVVALVAVVGLLPWVLRNHQVVGAYTLSTNTGDNLCMSRQPGANGAFLFTDYCAGDITADIPRGDYERIRDDAGRQKAIDFVRDHPLTELELWPQRLWHTVENDFDGLRAVESYGDDPFLPDGLRRALQLISDLWFVLVVLAAAIAVPRAWKADRVITVLVVGAIVATVVLPAIAFFGDPRFHVPAAPFLAVLAAVLLVRRRPATT
jgi:4-amino-4-deoxy-L-arabinose transferase-like glycosyltransferase